MSVLLDTCALVRLGDRERMTNQSRVEIAKAILSNAASISPVSAWELGMLSQPRPGRSPRVQFIPNLPACFATFEGGSYAFAPFTCAMAFASSVIPDPFHADPFDRMLVATARHLGAALVTSDLKILAYAKLGHVKAIKL